MGLGRRERKKLNVTWVEVSAHRCMEYVLVVGVGIVVEIR
jgi:hypothetical protein